MSTLSLKTLQDSGGFAGKPERKQIKWESGGGTHEAEVWVRPLSYAAAVSDIRSPDAVAGRIASCILGDDMQPIFTEEDVTGEADPERGSLCHSLTIELLRVIGEVSYPGKAKPSARKKKSGTS